MPQFSRCAPSDARSIADLVLYEFQQGNTGVAAEQLTHEMRGLDSAEAERIEVLEGALAALSGNRQGQIEAGMYLLKHLASRPVRISFHSQTV